MNRADRRAGPRATRKLRRWLGYYNPIMRPTPAPVPRYIRRHLGVNEWWGPNMTRRQRKVLARITRITARLGRW